MLVIVGVLGGVAPIVMKISLKEFTPLQIAFTRFFFASLILIPIAISRSALRFTTKDLIYLTLASFLFAGNILFFVLGLSSTTAIASQLLYLLVPVLVLVLSSVILKHPIAKRHLLSLGMGGTGGLLLIMQRGGVQSSSLGSLQGNATVLMAVISWSTYLVVSKKISAKHNALGILTINSCMSALGAGLYLGFSNTMPFRAYTQASASVLLGLGFLVVVSSILFFFLYQRLIKQVKPFTLSLTAYVGVLSTAVIAVPLFNESMTPALLASAALIFASSYLALRNR
jgi:drug/metabolite transporter (DMT)-like permease